MGGHPGEMGGAWLTGQGRGVLRVREEIEEKSGVTFSISIVEGFMEPVIKGNSKSSGVLLESKVLKRVPGGS